MYLVNIFINSMFKSSYLRIMCTLLISLFLIWQGASAGFRDTLSGPVPDTIHPYTPEFNRLLDRAIHLQHRADSLRRLTIEWRKTADKMDDPVSRGRLQKKIMQAEDSVRSCGRCLRGCTMGHPSDAAERVRQETRTAPRLTRGRGSWRARSHSRVPGHCPASRTQ